MRINGFRLTLLTIFIASLQLLVNSQTSLYLDGEGVILVLLLISGGYTLRTLILISFFADLIGHWYLGSHLFAILLLSLLTGSIISFFHVCSFLQKTFILMVFYAMFSAIMTTIDLCTHNVLTGGLNFAIELVILCPVICMLFNITIIKHSENILL